jgi:hypothetical protein
MIDWVGITREFIKWFPDRNKVIITLWLIAGLARFLPMRTQLALGVSAVTGAHPALELIVFAVCSAILITEGVDKVWASAKIRAELDRKLRGMTKPQKDLVTQLLAGEVVLRFAHESGAEELRRDGILFREPAPGNRDEWVYGLETEAKGRAIALGMGPKAGL